MTVPSFRRRRTEPTSTEHADEQRVLQVDLDQLSAVFAAPRWLRDLGLLAWFLVGVAAVVVGLVLLLGATAAITQPVLTAFGATLGLNPLVVLIVTVGAGALFGMVGLVLAAPLTSAAVHISADLARARTAALAAEEGAPGEPEPAPG